MNLIKRLMDENNKKISLPEIQLPTENGKLLELPDFTEEHGEFEEEEEIDAECSEVIFQKMKKAVHFDCLKVSFGFSLSLSSIND